MAAKSRAKKNAMEKELGKDAKSAYKLGMHHKMLILLLAAALVVALAIAFNSGAEYASSKNNVTVLSGLLSSMRAHYSNLSNEYNYTKSNIGALQLQILQQNRTIAQLKGDANLTSAEENSTIAALKAEWFNASRTDTSLEAELKSNESTIAQLSAELSNDSRSIVNLESQLAGLDAKSNLTLVQNNTYGPIAPGQGIKFKLNPVSSGYARVSIDSGFPFSLQLINATSGESLINYPANPGSYLLVQNVNYTYTYLLQINNTATSGAAANMTLSVSETSS